MSIFRSRHAVIIGAVCVFASPDFSAKAASASSEDSAVVRDCSVCPELVLIPAGEFEQGSLDGEADERPPKRVAVGPLLVGRFEVTRREFSQFVREARERISLGCSVFVEVGAGDGAEAQWLTKPNASWQSPGYVQGEQHPGRVLVGLTLNAM